MIETYCRPVFQRYCVHPVVYFLQHRTVCTPLRLTLFSGMTGILSAFCVGFQFSYLAVVLLWLSGYLDVLDGSLARLQNLQSSRGAVYDIVMDRVVEFSVMFALFSVDPIGRAYSVVWMLGSSLLCVTSFLVVGIFSEMQEGKKSFHYSVGLMERAEAFLFFTAMILFPAEFVLLAWVYTGLVLLTGALRIYQFQSLC